MALSYRDVLGLGAVDYCRFPNARNMLIGEAHALSGNREVARRDVFEVGISDARIRASETSLRAS
jgi:hypothetical protein